MIEDAVGHRLALLHARDLRDQVVQALEVLDVHGGPDGDARLEQLLDVLPALRVARRGLAAEQIRVRELVDEQDRGAAFERRVEIELVPHDPAVADRQVRQGFEPFHEPLCLGAAVRLDVADHDLRAARARRACGREHREGLAYAGRGAEEDPELATLRARLFRLDAGQELVGVGPQLGRHSAPCCLLRRVVEREVELEHFTRGSPRTPSVRPLVAARTSVRTDRSSTPRARATRAT